MVGIVLSESHRYTRYPSAPSTECHRKATPPWVITLSAAGIMPVSAGRLDDSTVKSTPYMTVSYPIEVIAVSRSSIRPNVSAVMLAGIWNRSRPPLYGNPWQTVACTTGKVVTVGSIFMLKLCVSLAIVSQGLYASTFQKYVCWFSHEGVFQ